MVSEAMAEGTRSKRWANHRIAFVALWLTLVMLAIKVWVGWATRSLSLASEALHTLVTSFSLLLTLLTLFTPYASKRAPWGHTRLESGLTLLLVTFLGFSYCLLLGIAAQQIGFLGGAQTGSSTVVQVNGPILQMLSSVTIASFCFGVLGRYQSQLLDNPMLQFSFSQSLQDTGLMALVVFGLFGVQNGLGWLDPLLTIFILLVASFNVWRIVNWQLPSMMRQVAIAPEAVARTIRRVEGILHCYGIQSHGMVGRQVYVEMHLILHPECKSVAPAIVQRIEWLICQHYGPAKVVVYVDDESSPGIPNHRKP